MMILKEQIVAIIFSFIYGGILSVLYNFNYNILFSERKIIKIIFNIIFILDLVLIYFLIMRKINNAIIHPYFYLFIVVGFFVFFNFSKSLRSLIKIPKLKKTDQKCKK